MQITWYQICQNFHQAKKAAYPGNLATSQMKFLPISSMKERLAKNAYFGRFLTFLGNLFGLQVIFPKSIALFRQELIHILTLTFFSARNNRTYILPTIWGENIKPGRSNGPSNLPPHIEGRLATICYISTSVKRLRL